MPEASTNACTTERLALLSFKSMLSGDPSQMLVSWNNESLDFCQWRGVTCGNNISLGGECRVTALVLDSLGLEGPISSSLANLTFLQMLHLRNNSLQGPIPQFSSLVLTKLVLSHNKLNGSIPLSLAHLSSLLYLDLSFNALSGGIPPEIGGLSNLTRLQLGFNNLTGTIPATICMLQRLQVFFLRSNRLSGSIPPSLGCLSQLTGLYLDENQLSGGIPPSLGNLSSLAFLFLNDNYLKGSMPPSLGKLHGLNELGISSNNLGGNVPPSFWNLSSLEFFSAGNNELTGELRMELGSTLPRLWNLYLDFNRFHGPLPATLGNASQLKTIQLGHNGFSGTMPQGLGSLKNLVKLTLGHNQLEAKGPVDWNFVDDLTNCSKLRVLSIIYNRLEGNLPASIANLSSGIENLLLYGNLISGTIPAGIGNLVNLTWLGLSNNLLTGSIPTAIGLLQRLQLLHLDRNRLSGEIPSTIGNLSRLTELYLNRNHLRGSIPASIGDCPLERLFLSNNKLTGTIPREILIISTLSIYLVLSNNLLTGGLPSEVGSLRNLGSLYVSGNRLSGVIPSTLGNCEVLEYLYMNDNQFHGTIPHSLNRLKGLQELDLSCNNLSGKLPGFIGFFPFLTYLNVSFNNLEGEVPVEGIFTTNRQNVALEHNQLCGRDSYLGLPLCPNSTSTKRPMSKTQLRNLLLFILPLCMLSASLILMLKLARRPQPVVNVEDQSTVEYFLEGVNTEVSYEMLHCATEGFAASNLIGVGGSASVYKGTMDYNAATAVALKVLDHQHGRAYEEFFAECAALRNIKHRNILKVFAAISCFDYSGMEFKALIFEYMPNGNLEMWLHPEFDDQEDCKRLNLIERLNIVIDIALALDYLHNFVSTPIVHCDLKPSNVLLDYEMNAHVSDFGLASFATGEPTWNTSNLFDLRGSIGYIAPEYMMGSKASTQGDVYSYGILLLETFTGKRPTHEIFKDGLGLRNYVEMAYPNRLIDVLDKLLVSDIEDAGFRDNGQRDVNARIMLECLASVFRIGLLCSEESPNDRMRIGDVINIMMELKVRLVEPALR